MSDYDTAGGVDTARIMERAEEFAAADNRFPLRIHDGYHTTDVAAGTPEMDATAIGFYEPVLEQDYNDLVRGQWLMLEYPRENGTDRYQVQVRPVDARTASDVLSDEELDSFERGGALLAGRLDHQDRSYNPWKVDDRIHRETVHRSSLVPPGEQVNLWTVTGPDELPWESLGDLGHPLAAEMKGDDHRVHFT